MNEGSERYVFPMETYEYALAGGQLGNLEDILRRKPTPGNEDRFSSLIPEMNKLAKDGFRFKTVLNRFAPAGHDEVVYDVLMERVVQPTSGG